MKIKKLRIRNYKSIIDSGDCYLEKDLTILAGKNESGKTSILEALEDFNIERNISDSARPIGKVDLLPKITLTLIMMPGEINAYYEGTGIEKTVSKENEIEITKTYPNKYSVNEATESLLELGSENQSNEQDDEKEKNIETKINELYSQLQRLYNQHFKVRGWPFFGINFQDIPSTQNQLKIYTTNYQRSYLNVITDQNTRKIHLTQLQQLQKLLDEFQNNVSEKEEKIDNWKYLFEMIPNFILFNSFDDILPNQVSFEQLKENGFIKDLSIISELDTDLIISKDERTKGKHKRDLNVTINKEYKQFWVQDLTKITIEWNSDTLFFWIEEDGEFYKPSERSKGKQWHMSFYTKVTARALEEGINVILIDEPGLFLHAAAQNDIYKKLIDMSKNSQILFTTHSPYLINKDELYRVRLIIKVDTKKSGTKVENKIHAKADKETLTPILTAIGLGLSDGIQNINQEKNIVVEGPSDYFYMQGLKIVLNRSLPNIVFGGGSGNVGNVGAILMGWGCKVIYLFDNDKGKKDGTKNLAKPWYVSKELIHSVKDGTGSIEDLFSVSDFKKYVLQDNSAKIEGTNTEYIKKTKPDKVLLAKQFNSLCHNSEVKLNQKTLEHVEKLFGKLENAFLSSNGEFGDEQEKVEKPQTSLSTLAKNNGS